MAGNRTVDSIAPSAEELKRLSWHLEDQYGIRPGHPEYDASLAWMRERLMFEKTKAGGASREMSWLGGGNRPYTRPNSGSSGARPATVRDVPDHGRLAPQDDFRRSQAEAQMRRLRDITRVEQMNANFSRERKLADAGLDPYYRPLKKE